MHLRSVACPGPAECPFHRGWARIRIPIHGLCIADRANNFWAFDLEKQQYEREAASRHSRRAYYLGKVLGACSRIALIACTSQSSSGSWPLHSTAYSTCIWQTWHTFRSTLLGLDGVNAREQGEWAADCGFGESHRRSTCWCCATFESSEALVSSL